MSNIPYHFSETVILTTPYFIDRGGASTPLTPMRVHKVDVMIFCIYVLNGQFDAAVVQALDPPMVLNFSGFSTSCELGALAIGGKRKRSAHNS